MTIQDTDTKAKPMAALNKELRNEKAGFSHRPTDLLRESARAGQEKLRETGDYVSERMQLTGEQIQDGLITAKRQGRGFVRKNPGVALTGAFGLGVLVAAALRERS